MSEQFDPYHEWLGIPASEQPPNHYRLLGVPAFEDSPTVIENAADQRMAHLRTFQLGKRSAQSQKLLNEVAAAKVCLLNPGKKSPYDELLRQKLEATRPKLESSAVDSGFGAGLAALLETGQSAAAAKPARPKKKPSANRAPIFAAAAVVAGFLLLGLVMWATRPSGGSRESAQAERPPATVSGAKSDATPGATGSASAKPATSEKPSPMATTGLRTRIFASGCNGHEIRLNGEPLMRCNRDSTATGEALLREGDVIAVKLGDRFDIMSLWMMFQTAEGEYLFETCDDWNAYLPVDETRWWDIEKKRPGQQKAKYAPSRQEYVGRVKKAAQEAVPNLPTGQPITSPLKGEEKYADAYLYYAVTREDLLPKKSPPKTAPSLSWGTVVTITASADRGYVLGPVQRGTTLRLQYEQGKWKTHGRKATNSPDDPKVAADDQNRLAIADAPGLAGSGTVLQIVPGGTAQTPFVWRADRDYENVVLRIQDCSRSTSRPGHVKYRVELVKP